MDNEKVETQADVSVENNEMRINEEPDNEKKAGSETSEESSHSEHHTKTGSSGAKDHFMEKLIHSSREELIAECSELHKKNHELHKETEKLRKTAEEKEKESLDYLDRYRRSLAEVENVRRRLSNDKQEAIKYANTNIINDLIIITDDFERALESGKNENVSKNDYMTGIELIERQFTDLLFKKYGLVAVGTKGEEFDPSKHEAVMMEEGDFENEVVTEVFRKGYSLHERVLRAAQVKIGKPKS